MRYLVIFLLVSMAYGQLPEEPKPQFMDTSPRALKLIEPKKDRIFNKKFIAVNLLLLGSTVFDVEVTHQGLAHHNCLEANGNSRNPSRGNLYARELPIDGVLFGFGILMRKAKVPIAPYVPALIGSGRHLYFGSQWFTQGCF